MSTVSPERPSTQVVLIVEDEPVLRSSMVRALAKVPWLEVVDAGTVRDAKKLLSACRPALLVTDLDLPDGSGLDLIAELEGAALRIPVVVATAYLHAYRGRVPLRSDVLVLEKPLTMEKLRRVVNERVGVQLTRSPFGVADYVQLAGMGRRSVVVEVTSRSRRGRIDIRSGEVWAATDDEGKGMPAFQRLAFLDDAIVTCRSLDPKELPPRTIEGSCDGVLLEAARLADEAVASGAYEVVTRASDSISVSARPSLSPDDGARLGDVAFDEAFERGVDALLAKNHGAAYEAFRDAATLRPTDPRVVANLHRLREMGFGT